MDLRAVGHVGHSESNVVDVVGRRLLHATVERSPPGPSTRPEAAKWSGFKAQSCNRGCCRTPRAASSAETLPFVAQRDWRKWSEVADAGATPQVRGFDSHSSRACSRRAHRRERPRNTSHNVATSAWPTGVRPTAARGMPHVALSCRPVVVAVLLQNAKYKPVVLHTR